MSIQTKALNQALAILHSIKAQYIVVASDGTSYSEGGLTLAEEAAPPKRQRKYPAGQLKSYYRERMEVMKVGDVLKVTMPTIPMAQDVRGAAAAFGNTLWGNQSYISTVEDCTLELLRVK